MLAITWNLLIEQNKPLTATFLNFLWHIGSNWSFNCHFIIICMIMQMCKQLFENGINKIPRNKCHLLRMMPIYIHIIHIFLERLCVQVYCFNKCSMVSVEAVFCKRLLQNIWTGAIISWQRLFVLINLDLILIYQEIW